LIKSAYGISWAYLVGDVGHEGYKAYLRNQWTRHPGVPGIQSRRSSDARNAASTSGEPPKPGHVPAIEDYRTVMVERALFQGIASMGLPAFMIHSIVRYSGRALKNAKSTTIRKYGPIGVSGYWLPGPHSGLTSTFQLGLVAVPFLPFLFDKPVEIAVERNFHRAFETFGGPDAVAQAPTTSITQALSRKSAAKDKEL